MDNRRSLKERKYCYLNKIKIINPDKYINSIQPSKRVGEGERKTIDKNSIKESDVLSESNSNVKALVDIIQSDRGDSILSKIDVKQEEENIKRDAYIIKSSEVSYTQNNDVNNNDVNNKVKDKINSKLTKSIGHLKKNLPNRQILNDDTKVDLRSQKPEALITGAKYIALESMNGKGPVSLHKDEAGRKPRQYKLNKKHTNMEDIKSNAEAIDNNKRNDKSKSLIVNMPHSVADINTNSIVSKEEEYIDQLNVPSDTSKTKYSHNKCIGTMTGKGSLYSHYNYQRKLRDKNKNGDSKCDARTISLNQQNKASQKSISIPRNLHKKTRIPKLIKTYSNKKIIDISQKNKLGLKVSLENRKGLQKKDALSPITPKRNMDSPPTEVAKWVPNSINKHTKLYYEAWVNTTLAAVSKSKYGKILLDKPNIQDFRKYLEERAKSPELMYEDYSDKRFIGTIKVNHKK